MARHRTQPKPTAEAAAIGAFVRELRCDLHLHVADVAMRAGWSLRDWHWTEDGSTGTSRALDALDVVRGLYQARDAALNDLMTELEAA